MEGLQSLVSRIPESTDMKTSLQDPAWSVRGPSALPSLLGPDEEQVAGAGLEPHSVAVEGNPPLANAGPNLGLGLSRESLHLY